MILLNFKNIQFFLSVTTPTSISPLNLFNSVFCERELSSGLSISCSTGVVNVIDANYGRKDSQTCCNAIGSTICTNNINCYLNETENFKSKCDYQQICTFLTISIPDPCRGTYKYLEIFWECLNARK